MPSSNVAWDITGSIAVVSVHRPEARNALTWEMYAAMADAFAAAEADANVRVLIIRGTPGAFAAGTDISQFRNFSGDDGVGYEQRLDAFIERLESLPLITIAEIDGVAVGGGCAIAFACDVRVCSERATFGVPVARTLGNCLSMNNTARLVDALGPVLARDVLLTGRIIDVHDAAAHGLVNAIVPTEELEQETYKLAADLSTRARSTVKATKALLARLREHRRPPAGSATDIIRECYGSAEFKEGVDAFLAGRRPNW